MTACISFQSRWHGRLATDRFLSLPDVWALIDSLTWIATGGEVNFGSHQTARVVSQGGACPPVFAALQLKNHSTTTA
jgi:hypothetical protein